MTELNSRLTALTNKSSKPLLNDLPADRYDALLNPDDDNKHQTLLRNQRIQRSNRNDEQAAQPFVNNQNTILMAARSCKGDLMLMHETRIFYFSSDKTDHDMHDDNTNNAVADVSKSESVVINDDYTEAVDYLTSLLLGMLMTRKYRLITSFYILWHILDYAMLTALVLTLFFTSEPSSFQDIITDNSLIFGAVAIELFYDVLEFIVKIWILNRVSIYIGFILYILYFVALYEYFEDRLVSGLLIARFVAFIFEEVIDFCIDLELDYDLREREIHKLEIPMCFKTEHEERIALLHVGNHNEIQLPNGWRFKGSLCVWTWKNTFNVDVEKSDVHPLWYIFYQIIFHFMFFTTYCIIGIPLLMFTWISIAVLSVFGICCCKASRRDTICDECCHRYSY